MANLDSQGRPAESFMCISPLSVMLVVCYLDSGETRIIKIHIAKKNTENFKNCNVLYAQKFLALRYPSATGGHHTPSPGLRNNAIRFKCSCQLFIRLVRKSCVTVVLAELSFNSLCAEILLEHA